MESVLGPHETEVSSPDGDAGEGSSPDMDFHESEDATDDEDKKDTFMDSYSDALNRELKSSTLPRSFVRANAKPSKTNQGASSSTQDMDEDFTPFDVDVNLVKSLLDSLLFPRGTSRAGFESARSHGAPPPVGRQQGEEVVSGLFPFYQA